ncbi:sulfatase [Membranihabitans maritimus]|uniref:sulfatase n=1 Tax=Membranihabitans maritimus TaxID=2904244 RepID=UPI001F2D5EFC|nr:sulfatase [Membranihabitans maritimus]
MKCIDVNGFFFFLLPFFTLGTLSAQESQSNQNVIVIIADDLGWSDLGIYGSDLHETPNLDRLARENVRFSQFYSASPVCSPTRASIITGKHPARLHMTTHFENSGDYSESSAFVHNRRMVKPTTVGNLPLEEETIAEIFKKAGYFTAHLGKWHLGNFDYYPENHGFDINIGGTAWGAPDTYWYPFGGNNYQKQLRYIPGLELGSHDSSYLTDRLTDRAIEIIDAKKDQRFFIQLSYYNPHTPIEGKPDWVEYFKKKVKPGMKHKNYNYAAMIASLDENVGRIIDKLEIEEIQEETIIVFLSDNGGRIGPYFDWETVANNQPLRSGKGSLYEGGIRVPLIIKWPGRTEGGKVCNIPAMTTDLLPTLVEMNNLKASSDEIDGLNLATLLENPDFEFGREYLFWHYPHYYSTTTPVNAVRNGDWKLLHYFEDDKIELYNLKGDIGETEDLTNIYPEKANDLYGKLLEWRKEVNAQFPAFNPDFHPESWDKND